jgi:hypothetical protein
MPRAGGNVACLRTTRAHHDRHGQICAQGYQGADAALTLIILGMSCAEVTEGNRRAADLGEVPA